MKTRFLTLSWTGALLLALAAACAERGAPVAPIEPVPPEAPPPGPVQLTRVACRVDVRKLEMTCGDGGPALNARAAIVGEQNRHVKLTSSNVGYAGETFSFDLTVMNLLPRPLGTFAEVEEELPHPNGVRVFIAAGPTATSGTGTTTVLNSDGTASFGTTYPNQHYFQYSGALLGDGVLDTLETSLPRNWQFHVPYTVAMFSFELLVSAAMPPSGWIDIGGAPRVLVGGTRTLTATVRSYLDGSVIPGGMNMGWSTSDPSVATASQSNFWTKESVITGVTPGRVVIHAFASFGYSGSVVVQVCADTSLPVGGAAILSIPADSVYCLVGGTAGAEYTVIPVNLGTADVPLSVTAEGTVAVSGAPSPTRIPTASAFRVNAARGNGGFEPRLRERERRELAGLFRAGRRSPSAAAGSRRRGNLIPGEPVPGDLVELNVEVDNLCSTADVRTARVMGVGAHVVVLADTANPPGGFRALEYQEFISRFESLVWPTLTGAFGAPGDEDANERVALFFTRAVNELTPSGGAYNAGFFLARDLFSTFSCPTSNVGEMIYLAVPDPNGTVNGNARSYAFVKDQVTRTIGHEMQHLVNASHRLYASAPPEETWLNEGLSGVAEELLFYAASGKAPGQNVGFSGVADGGVAQSAFLPYADPNLARLHAWLLAPHAAGPARNPSTPGATWALLRYMADRKGGTESAFWSALAGSSATGMTNLQAALGTDPGPWIRDFAVATYADDAVAGAAAVHSQPSWSFRSLYGALDYDGNHFPDGYPLKPRDLTAGVTDSFTLAAGGGTAYLRMGVPASEVATVAFSSNGDPPPSTLHVVVIRRK